MNDLIRKYRNKELYDLNCSEAILYAANEYYGFDLSENALNMMSGFGGGHFEKRLCGIVSGAIAVLGVVFKGKVYNGEPILKLAVLDFKNQFRDNYETIECEYIVDKYKSKDTGCDNIIFNAADILDSVIIKYRKLA